MGTGDVLVEISVKEEDKAKFGARIGGTIGASGEVRQMVPRSILLIRDLDALSSEDENRSALVDALGKSAAGFINMNN